MKKGMVLGAIFLVLSLLVVSFVVGDIAVPEIEKWQLLEEKDWIMSNKLNDQPPKVFKIGVNKLYQDPSNPNVFGGLMSLIGSDEIIMKTWIKCKNDRFVLTEIEEMHVAIKTEDGNWFITKLIEAQHMTDNITVVLPKIQNGTLLNMKIVLFGKGGIKKVIRTIEFNPPLSPLPEN